MSNILAPYSPYPHGTSTGESPPQPPRDIFNVLIAALTQDEDLVRTTFSGAFSQDPEMVQDIQGMTEPASSLNLFQALSSSPVLNLYEQAPGVPPEHEALHEQTGSAVIEPPSDPSSLLYDDGTIRAFPVHPTGNTFDILSLCSKENGHLSTAKYFGRKCAVPFYVEDTRIVYKVGNVGEVCKSKLCPLYGKYRAFFSGEDGDFVTLLTKEDLKDKLVEAEPVLPKKKGTAEEVSADARRNMPRACKNTAPGAMQIQDRIIDINGKTLKSGKDALSMFAKSVDMDEECIDVADNTEFSLRKKPRRT